MRKRNPQTDDGQTLFILWVSLTKQSQNSIASDEPHVPKQHATYAVNNASYPKASIGLEIPTRLNGLFVAVRASLPLNVLVQDLLAKNHETATNTG